MVERKNEQEGQRERGRIREGVREKEVEGRKGGLREMDE